MLFRSRIRKRRTRTRKRKTRTRRRRTKTRAKIRTRRPPPVQLAPPFQPPYHLSLLLVRNARESSEKARLEACQVQMAKRRRVLPAERSNSAASDLQRLNQCLSLQNCLRCGTSSLYVVENSSDLTPRRRMDAHKIPILAICPFMAMSHSNSRILGLFLAPLITFSSPIIPRSSLKIPATRQ